MSIDLTGLFTHDVEIRMQGNGVIVKTRHKKIIEDILALPSPIWTNQMAVGLLDVSPHGIDCIAFAERLALTWEGEGYVVKRFHTPLYSFDSKQIQSFILV